MTFILVTRNPRSGKLFALQELDDSVTEYPTREAADEAAMLAPALIAWGYQPLEVDA